MAQKVIQQEGYVPVQFQVPSDLLQKLRAKYDDKNRMDATFRSLCAHMVEPSMLIIGNVDLKRISDKVGMPVRSSGELYGILEAKVKEISDLKEQLAQSPASAGGGGGTALRRGELIVWFNPDHTGRLVEQAKGAGLQAEAFVEKFIGEGLDNGWF